MRGFDGKSINIMAKDKKAFVLYADLIHTVSKLPDKEAGMLFKHILNYVNDENPQTDNIVIEIAFEPIKQQLKRDLEKWENIRVLRSKAGKASADKRQQMLTPVESVEQTPTNPTVSDTVIVNDTVKVKDIYKEFDFFKDEFKDIWLKEFLPLKKKKKASVSDRALISQLNNIKKLSNNNYKVAVEILEKSVNSGWTDFYELKKDTKKTNLAIDRKEQENFVD